ncbi:MAG TPA: hypothetical protein VFU47_04285 [Armatimonadota bacterium]|nr:hypothetical protein [Armatimonadota bacterium]
MTMAFTNEDYFWVTGGAAPGTVGGRLLSAVSARRLQNGNILICSRTPANQLPNPMAPTNLYAGADVFLLRSEQYLTSLERGGAPYNRAAPATHGWKPEQWAQGALPPALKGPSCIRWRAAESLDPTKPPTLRTQIGTVGSNPYELSGTYIPSQPNYADVVY